MTELELEQLKKLQDEIKRRGVTFMPSIAAMATRFLSRARGDTAKAIKLMQATQSWRQEFFTKPVTDEAVKEDMKHGIVYFCGRDFAMRPTIVVRAIRIPQQWYKDKRIDKLINVLIFSMEYMIRYMIVPGSIENNCLIIDLKGLTISQVPLGALTEVYKVMSHHYIGRVFKFYICNLSMGLSTMAGMAKALLTDRQKQKLVFLDNVKELRKEFALHQLEEDLGGSRPVITEFFPFPMPAGPFDRGYDKGPDANAIPGGHTVLTRAGARGHLWDTRLSRGENMRLEYSPEAPEFFRRCNLPIPPSCLKQAQLTEDKAAVEEEEEEEDTTNANDGLSPDDKDGVKGGDIVDIVGPGDNPNTAEDSTAWSDADENLLQDAAKSRSMFGCLQCWCSHR